MAKKSASGSMKAVTRASSKPGMIAGATAAQNRANPVRKPAGKPGMVAGATAAQNRANPVKAPKKSTPSVLNGGSSYASASQGMNKVTVNAMRPTDYSGPSITPDFSFDDFFTKLFPSKIQDGMTGNIKPKYDFFSG